MGCSPMRVSSGDDTSPPNPNPKNFKILEHIQVKNHTMVIVEYEGCTTYEGKKVIVYKDTPYAKIYMANELDPHFIDKSTKLPFIKPFARFEPTAEGMESAVKLMRIL